MIDLSNCVSSEIRSRIIDQLIAIGQCSGKNGRVKDFVRRTFPAVLPSLLNEIEQHMDSFHDWTFDQLFYDKLDILNISDDDFFAFCKNYMSPIYKRKTFNQDNEEWVDLSEKCFSAINDGLLQAGYEMIQEKDLNSGNRLYKIVLKEKTRFKPIKNILFAANQAKPDIVFDDALSNEIRIINDGDSLVYDEDIPNEGITWKHLVEWYKKTELQNTEEKLKERLLLSLESHIEKTFFNGYLVFLNNHNNEIPALIPQVYLYYDPKTKHQRVRGEFEHQRMDFMMIISPLQRVIIELDGVQHYGTIGCYDGKYPKYCADIQLYADMMKAQREMSLAGYDVYRFGGKELFIRPGSSDKAVISLINDFFERLLTKYRII